MEPEKRRLLERIDRNRELLITFLQEFIRCPTPNQPGDTRIAARNVQKLLDTHGVAYRVIAPNVEVERSQPYGLNRAGVAKARMGSLLYAINRLLVLWQSWHPGCK
jgi:hypothetical protein